MTLALVLLPVLSPALAQDSTRWWVEDEVHLPLPMWLGSPSGPAARILGWRAQMMLSCGPVVPETKKAGVRTCDIEDVSLLVAPHPADQGRLAEQILPDTVAILRDARIEIRVDVKRGPVGVDVEGFVGEGARSTAIVENLGLLVTRAVAGLDLVVGEPGVSEWKQGASLIMRVADDAAGASGKATVLHRATGPDQAGRLAITSTGDGSSIRFVAGPGATETMDAWRLEMDSKTSYDPATGTIWARQWNATGSATASSAGATSSRPYVQKGRLDLLGPGELRELAPSAEGELPGMAAGDGGGVFLGADLR